MAYIVSAALLGLGDALAMTFRLGGPHDLTSLEVLLLPILSNRLYWPIHVCMLSAGATWFAFVELLPLRSPLARTALLVAPLAIAFGAMWYFMLPLPFFKFLPMREVLALVAATTVPIGVTIVGVSIARWKLRATAPWRIVLILAIAAGLIAFIVALCPVEAVMVRIPATLFTLLATAYLVRWLLPQTAYGRRWLTAALALPTATLLLAYAPQRSAAAPTINYRIDAAVAYSTEISQALLLAKLFVFGPTPEFPACPTSEVGPPSEAVIEQPALNVVLLTIDALRSDRMASGGYDRNTMPNVERLAEESLSFETSYSPSPATAGSLFAQWTGFDIPVVRTGDIRPPSLPELLGNEGYATFGSDLEPPLRVAAPTLNAPAFDVSVPLGTKAGALVDAMIGFIQRQRTRPFLTVAHFMESHDVKQYESAPVVFPDRAWSRYDDALFYIDKNIGRLLEAIDSLGLREETIVLVSADHGEFFGEHGRLFHGSVLYEPVVRVPLILRAPGREPRRVPLTVSGFDFAPTLYRAATGKPWPIRTMGDDVVALAEHTPLPAARAVFMENVPGNRGVRWHVAVRKDRWKYTAFLGTDVEQLFDIAADPEESHNRAGDVPDVLAQMRSELNAALRRRACAVTDLRRKR